MAPDRTPTPGPSPSSSTPGKSGCPHATWRSPPGPGTGPTWASTSYRSSAACRCPGSCPRPRSPARTPPPANAWSPSPTRRTTSRRRGLSPHPPQHRPVLTGRGHLEPEGVVRLERATELGRLVGREAVMRAVRQRKLCPELAPDGLGEFSAVARVPIDRHSLSSTRGTRPSGAPYATTVRLVGDDLDATRWPAKRRRRVRAAQSRRRAESQSGAIREGRRSNAEVQLAHPDRGSVDERTVPRDADDDSPHPVTPRRGTAERVVSHAAEHVPEQDGVAAAVTADRFGDGDLLRGREVPLD